MARSGRGDSCPTRQAVPARVRRMIPAALAILTLLPRTRLEQAFTVDCFDDIVLLCLCLLLLLLDVVEVFQKNVF